MWVDSPKKNGHMTTLTGRTINEIMTALMGRTVNEIMKALMGRTVICEYRGGPRKMRRI